MNEHWLLVFLTVKKLFVEAIEDYFCIHLIIFWEFYHIFYEDSKPSCIMHMIQNKHRLCHRFQVDNEKLEASISDAADIYEKYYFKIKDSKPVTNCCRVLA